MASIENRQKNTRSRKRRSNSDSELVLANYSEKYFSSASPDRKYFFNPSIGINSYAIDDIDISADNQFFNARFTMDTSQMFMPIKKEISFSSSSPVHDLSSDINISSSQNEQNQPDFYESLHNCAVYMESDYLNHIEPPQEFQTIDSTKQVNWPPFLQNVTERKECVNKMWVVMKEDKKSLLEKGLEWKSGSWSSEEESMLQSNISKYCKKNGLADASIMIFSTPREKRKEFYRSIAIGLNRPLFAIYRKVLRMYNEKNYVGKYTYEEVEKLAELCQIHGNDWATIGYHLGRSPGSVRDKARLLKCHKKRGKWDEGELKLLSDTVHAHTNTKKGESVTGGINWTKVAEKIQTRTEKQCRSKWLNFLNWYETGGKEWNKLDDVELISKVAKLNATNETQIDWRELAKDWCSVRSPQWLKGRWHGIKKNVPNYQHSALNDILGHLQTTYVEQTLLKLNERVSGGDDLLQIEINSESDLESTLNRNQLKVSGLNTQCSTLLGFEVCNHVLSHRSGQSVQSDTISSGKACVLSNRDQSVIAYLCGYVFSTLYRSIRFSDIYKEEYYQQYISILLAAQYQGNDDLPEHKLVNTRNRSGLWKMKIKAICIFITAETTFKNMVRKSFNKIDSKDIIFLLLKDTNVLSNFSKIRSETNTFFNKEVYLNVFEGILNLYVKARTFFYVKDNLQAYKIKVQQLKSKSLRTSLKKKSTYH